MTPPAKASHLLAAAIAALCAVGFLGSCKRITEKGAMRPVEIGTPWERRVMGKARQAQEEQNAAAAGDHSAGYMANELDEKKTVKFGESGLGKKRTGEKTFRTKEFSGADEYKHSDYHFLKRQDYNAKKSAEEDRRFSAAGTEAREGKQRSIFGRKRAREKTFAESDKRVLTGMEADTRAKIERMENKDLNIVRDDAAEDGATMSVGDLRTILHGAESQ